MKHARCWKLVFILTHAASSPPLPASISPFSFSYPESSSVSQLVQAPLALRIGGGHMGEAGRYQVEEKSMEQEYVDKT